MKRMKGVHYAIQISKDSVNWYIIDRYKYIDLAQVAYDAYRKVKQYEQYQMRIQLDY